MAKIKHASRLERKYIFDFAGRQITLSGLLNIFWHLFSNILGRQIKEAQNDYLSYNYEDDLMLQETLNVKSNDLLINSSSSSQISDITKMGINNPSLSVRPMVTKPKKPG